MNLSKGVDYTTHSNDSSINAMGGAIKDGSLQNERRGSQVGQYPHPHHNLSVGGEGHGMSAQPP